MIIFAFITTEIYLILPLCLFGLLIAFQLRTLFKAKIKQIEGQIDYYHVHQGPFKRETIIIAIANIFAGFLTITFLGASFGNFGPVILLTLLGLFIGFLLTISIFVYKIAHA